MSQRSDSDAFPLESCRGSIPDVVLLKMDRGVGQWRLRNAYSARVLRKRKCEPSEVCCGPWEGNFTDSDGNVIATSWREDGSNCDSSCGFDLVEYERPLGPDPQKFHTGVATSKPARLSPDVIPGARIGISVLTLRALVQVTVVSLLRS